MSQIVTVNGRKLVKSGTNQRGAWNLYELDLADANGIPMSGNFKTFEENLPIGVPVSVDMEARPNERYGTSYTLTLAGNGAQAAAPARQDDPYENLATQLRLALDKIRALEEKVFGGPTPAYATSQTDVPAPVVGPVGGGDVAGDDIPFAPSVV